MSVAIGLIIAAVLALGFSLDKILQVLPRYLCRSIIQGGRFAHIDSQVAGHEFGSLLTAYRLNSNDVLDAEAISEPHMACIERQMAGAAKCTGLIPRCHHPSVEQ